MSKPPTRQKGLAAQTMQALAAQVVLPMTPLPETAGHCPAWIKAKGAECKRPATDGLLCRRHHHVAERRLAAAIEKRQAKAVKAAERARLTVERADIILAQADKHEAKTVEAEAQISTGGDLAAYGGAMHARIESNQHRLNERDHKLWKFAELNRRAAVRLRAQVERARTEVQE